MRIAPINVQNYNNKALNSGSNASSNYASQQMNATMKNTSFGSFIPNESKLIEVLTGYLKSSEPKVRQEKLAKAVSYAREVAEKLEPHFEECTQRVRAAISAAFEETVKEARKLGVKVDEGEVEKIRNCFKEKPNLDITADWKRIEFSHNPDDFERLSAIGIETKHGSSPFTTIFTDDLCNVIDERHQLTWQYRLMGLSSPLRMERSGSFEKHLRGIVEKAVDAEDPAKVAANKYLMETLEPQIVLARLKEKQ